MSYIKKSLYNARLQSGLSEKISNAYKYWHNKKSFSLYLNSVHSHFKVWSNLHIDAV